MRLNSCLLTEDCWKAVTKEYQAKSAYAQADLHQAFLDMRCMKGGDIREFLANLGYKREELAAASVDITDKEYERTILRGIPNELATFASQLLSSALIVHNAASVNINALVNQINKEADWLKTRRACGQSSHGGKKETTTDEALAATGSNDSRKKCRKGKCHNCDKLGHWAKECRSAKKDKEESVGTSSTPASTTTFKPENKPVGSANIIYDFDGNGFWMVNEKEADLTSIESTEPDPLLGDPDDVKVAPQSEGEEDNLDSDEKEWAGAVITPADDDSRIHVKLYDLGAT